MANSFPRDRLILLVGLITYGMGQSLLFVIFAPLARQLGLNELQLGLVHTRMSRGMFPEPAREPNRHTGPLHAAMVLRRRASFPRLV